MIDSITINAITPLTDRLEASELRVAVIPGTVLEAVSATSYSPVIDNDDSAGWIDNWQQSINRAPVFGHNQPIVVDGVTIVPTSQHDTTLTEAIKIVSDSVAGALGRARNVHSPLITEFIEAVSEEINLQQTITEPYEIIDLKLNDAWHNDVILASIRRFKDQKVPKPLKGADIPKIKPPEDIASYIKTGSAKLDSAFYDLLREIGMGPGDVFATMFSGANVGELPQAVHLNRNLILAQYIMANALIANPIPNSGLSATRWETLTKQMAMALAVCCNYVIANEEIDVKGDVLLIDVETKSGRFYLNGAVYEKFLDAGGSPELIYGAYMTANSAKEIRYQNLLDNADKFIRNWCSFHAAKQIRDNEVTLDNVKNALIVKLISAINNVDSAIPNPNFNKEGLIARAKEHVARVKLDWLDDIGLMCLRMYCDVLLSHTPTKDLLVRMNALCAQDIQGAEAASIVSVEYIADWIASAITLNR